MRAARAASAMAFPRVISRALTRMVVEGVDAWPLRMAHCRGRPGR